mgnify:CR=1 FL=1
MIALAVAAVVLATAAAPLNEIRPAAPATAASTAVPPAFSTFRPASTASGLAAAIMAWGASSACGLTADGGGAAVAQADNSRAKQTASLRMGDNHLFDGSERAP